MPKIRTTVSLDEEVLRLVRVRAARLGKGDSEVIEQSLRRDLGLDLLTGLWSRNNVEEATAIAVSLEAQAAARRGRRR